MTKAQCYERASFLITGAAIGFVTGPCFTNLWPYYGLIVVVFSPLVFIPVAWWLAIKATQQ